MAAPSITTKTWTGAADERFTYVDMNRITGNVNTLRTYLGLDALEFVTATRSSMFLHTEAQKIEDSIRMMAEGLSMTAPDVAPWGAGSYINYQVLDRWERSLQVIRDYADDGKVGVLFRSPCDIDASYEFVLPGGGVFMKGDRWRREMYVRLLPSVITYTLRISYAGDTYTRTFLPTSNMVISLDDAFCHVTATCPKPMEAVMYNGHAVEHGGGSSAEFDVIRVTGGRTVAAEVASDAPTYGGVSTEMIYGYSAKATVVPSSAVKAVSLTPVKVGNDVIIAQSGTLTVPTAGTYKIYAIGGGGRGADTVTGGAGSSLYEIGGMGGYSGHVADSTVELTATSYEIVIGATSQDTKFGNLVVAEGALGAGTLFGGASGGGGGGTSNGSYESFGSKGSLYGGGGGGFLPASGGSKGAKGGIKGGDGSDSATAKGGKGAGYNSTTVFGGSGGGGGYYADGGAGGGTSNTQGYTAGSGGGGGCMGGTGGRGGDPGEAGAGGRGYGAGGGGGATSAYYLDGNYVGPSAGGGGGGGYGTILLAESGTVHYDGGSGGKGAPGCVVITYMP